EPTRPIVPVTPSSASTRVVFPAAECPTSTTLRTLPGSSTTGAGPATPFSWLFCAIVRLPSNPADLIRPVHRCVIQAAVNRGSAPLGLLAVICATSFGDEYFKRSHTRLSQDTTPTRDAHPVQVCRAAPRR